MLPLDKNVKNSDEVIEVEVDVAENASLTENDVLTTDSSVRRRVSSLTPQKVVAVNQLDTIKKQANVK